MVPLALTVALVIIGHVYGRPPFPPLPVKDGCFHVSPEVEIFRMEGEAVVISCPIFERVLEVRKISSPTAKYNISRGNGTAGSEGEGRFLHRDGQLWLLPGLAGDSGEYTCTYRNETYCVTGSITLIVYESTFVDMEKISYPFTAVVGEKLTLRCPSLRHFNKDGQIDWYMESDPTDLQLGSLGSFHLERDTLMSQGVKRSDAGHYICLVRVLLNDQLYNASRIIHLCVHGTDPVSPTTVTDPTTTSDLRLTSAPALYPPVIFSPLNGTVFEAPHGSGLEIFCQVLTDCEMVDSTMITWLVNGQTVESSYVEGRALQGGRRETRVADGCQIELRFIVVAMTEEDVNAELRCVSQNQGGRQEVVVRLQLEDSTFTWLAVAVVAVSCFLTVVSVFLYVLFKPKQKKKKMDYFLTRQDSTF